MLKKGFSILLFVVIPLLCLLSFGYNSYGSVKSPVYQPGKHATIKRLISQQLKGHPKQLVEENYIKIRYMRGEVHYDLPKLPIIDIKPFFEGMTKGMNAPDVANLPSLFYYHFELRGPPAPSL